MFCSWKKLKLYLVRCLVSNFKSKEKEKSLPIEFLLSWRNEASSAHNLQVVFTIYRFSETSLYILTEVD